MRGRSESERDGRRTYDKKTSDMLVEKPYIAVIGEGGYCWYNGQEPNTTARMNK